ncbi:MAG: putative S-layer protein [Ignavibacteria bacterium]|nr:MAG: putative S-layer protein [Ignavibacteria bacterium]KAF0161705.1 MAG: putative S-layer protein [Ignavibacteria bacterium]
MVTSSQNNPAAGSDVTIEAQLTDQYGNVVLTAGKIVTWSKTGTGGNFGSSTSTTDANGKASVVLTVSQTALTTHKVTATDNSTPFITGSSGDIITKADVAIKYTVISSNNSPVAGSNVIINAQLKDKYDNNVLTEGKVVSWSSTNGGSFVSTTSNTNTLGLASIVFSTNKVVGTKHIITATDDAAVTGNSNEFTTVFSPPTKYIVTASKDNPDAGEQITLTAQLSDNDNNPIGIPGKVVSWVIDGALQSVTSNTDATGKTIFQLTTSKAANVFHVVSVYDNSVPSLTGRKSDIKTIPGPGSKYIVQASDYNPSANSTIQISARLVDQYDNFVLEAGKVITWRSTFGGKFGSATSITNASGEAKVDFNVHSQSGTLHIITATDNSSPALTGKTDYIDVKAGMAVKYYLSVSHNNPVAGDKITITALLIDEYLNLVAQSGKVIRWTSTNEGTFSSAASVVNNGEAKVEFTTNKKTNTRHAIKAKDADGIEGEIDGIVTRSGAGSKYLVISSSYNPPSGSVVVLTAQFSDDAGNAIKQADLEINWSSTNGGVFSSLTSKTDSDGKASVNFTTSNTTGTKHIIKAVDAQNRTGSSDEITTVNISPVKYLVASSNYEPFFGEKVSITAQLVDDKDNPVGIGGRDITWTSTNGGTFDKQTTKTDETGKASVEFTTSATANVKHNITANDNTKLTGTSKEIITQTLNAPILVSPIPQEENVPVQAKFAWRKSSKAEKYQLQVSTSSGFASLFHDATTPDTTKEVLTTYKTVYYWRVRAIRGTYISAWSEVRHYRSIVQKPGIPVLTAPVNNALNTPINLQLNWSPSFEAITYNLHISNNQDFSSLLVDQRGITSANYNLTQLQHDKKYYWKVSATNPAGNSEFSTVFSFTTIDTVLKPTNVSAIVDKELKVNLTWTDNANNETGFDIERTGPDGNTFALLRSVSANTTLIQDSEVVEGKRYKYRLRAKKNELYSVYSEIEEVTIPIKEIIPPVDLTIKPQPTGWLLLTWQFGTSNSIGGNIMSSTLNDILGVIVEREVYETPNSSIKLRYSSPMGSFVAIDTLPPNSTQYLDKDVKEGVRYNYRVSNYTTKGLSVPAVPKAPIITLLAPTALKVTKQGDAASLIWTDNTNLETGFYVTRTDKQDRNRYKLIDSTSANITSFTDNTVADGQTYYYQVYSYSGTLGFSAPTNTDSVSFAFKAPTELTVAKEAAFSIKVKWNDNSKSEIGYKIERKASDETAFKELVKTAANVSSYNDETVIDNKSYSYRVYAVISATELSIVTNTQTIDIPFYMPSDMKLTKASANKIQITWKDNSKSEAGYIVERKIKGEAQFKELNKTAANIVTYTDDNLADGKIYYYRIAGLTSATTSSNPTAVDSLTLPMIAPSDVTAKLAVDNNKMQITVTWKDNSQSETGYKIERKEGTGAYKEVGSVLANISTYTDADIVKNKDYTYRVKGYNADVTSDYSIEKVISDVIEQLVPTNFSISQNYPNPFNPTTKIKFALPQNGSTKLTIYNTLGESVVELINKELEAGYHEVEWNASQHSSGVYFYEIRSSDKISVKKMMLLK